MSITKLSVRFVLLLQSARQYGFTALHSAASGGHSAVVKQLIEAKADVSTLDKVSELMAASA